MRFLIHCKIIILLFPILGLAQRTEFNVFNSKGEHYKTYIKTVNDNSTSYTRYYYHKGKSIKNITITTSDELLNFKRYIFEYRYIEDTLKIRDAQNINQFVKKNDLSSQNFKTREIWTLYVRNDSLFRYDLSEYDPNRKGIPRFTQFHYFNYADSLLEVESYFLKFTHLEQFSKDSILIKKDGDLLIRYYLRWKKPYIFTSQKKDSLWTFGNDSIIYSEVVYEYNKEPFWKRLYLMTGGEGPIYHFEVIDMEEKLVKWKYDYVIKSKDQNEIKYDEKGRPVIVEYYQNEQLVKTIKIKYT